MSKNIKNYLFIGAGNMAKAIVTGSLTAKAILPEQIFIIDKNEQTHNYFKNLGCNIFFNLENINKIIYNINYIILAIKPQDSKIVLEDLALLLLNNNHKINSNQLPCIISIMAGITINNIQKYLSLPLYPCVRVMPNTPLLVGLGASAIVSKHINTEQKTDIDKLFASSGINCWLEDEEQLHAVTALSGSGPAYVFYILQAMQSIGIELGLPENIVRTLICQTFMGASTMALTQNKSLEQMQQEVMSKGGTTEAGINSFVADNIDDKFKQAIKKAYERSYEISKLF